MRKFDVIGVTLFGPAMQVRFHDLPLGLEELVHRLEIGEHRVRGVHDGVVRAREADGTSRSGRPDSCVSVRFVNHRRHGVLWAVDRMVGSAGVAIRMTVRAVSHSVSRVVMRTLFFHEIVAVRRRKYRRLMASLEVLDELLGKPHLRKAYRECGLGLGRLPVNSQVDRLWSPAHVKMFGAERNALGVECGDQVIQLGDSGASRQVGRDCEVRTSPQAVLDETRRGCLGRRRRRRDGRRQRAWLRSSTGRRR